MPNIERIYYIAIITVLLLSIQVFFFFEIRANETQIETNENAITGIVTYINNQISQAQQIPQVIE